MMEPSERQAEIFLAEDNLADVKLLQRFLREVPFPSHLSVVDNGEAALAFLEQHASYTEAPTPDLIILDAHLVKKKRLGSLAVGKSAPFLRHHSGGDAVGRSVAAR